MCLVSVRPVRGPKAWATFLFWLVLEALPSTFLNASTCRKDMYKHVSKQRKLADKNKQVVLSDESDDSDDEQLENSSSEAKSGSGSGEAEESEKAEEEEKQEEEEEKEEEVLNPPPTGYPTVTEALKDPIVYPVEAGGDGSEPEVVCVVCPDKALKKGKMLEVHVASNVSFHLSTSFLG